MTPIIFCRTRHVYESYLDFFKLAELGGFEIIYSDEIDITKEAVYILSPWNGDIEEFLKNEVGSRKQRNAHIILWNLERPSGSEGALLHYNRRQWDLIHNRWVDEIWVSDRRLSEESGLRFVILGSDEGLGSPGEKKTYNFCHMSYVVYRRGLIYNKFNQDHIGPNCWPPERDEVLRQSKFALNVHQDEHPFQEPLRLALFAAYGLPIVTERIIDSYPWTQETIVYSNYADIARKLNEILLEDYEPYKEMGLRAREMMTQNFRFKDTVENAVKESVDKYEWR